MQLPPPPRGLQCYELEGDDAVAAAGALVRGMVWCSAPQAAAAAAALLLLARRGRLSGLGLRLRALALVTLAAAAVNYVMYFKLLRIVRASNPGKFSLVAEPNVFLAAAMNLHGFVAFLLSRGDE
ncbi:unnamed protein product [Urochloa humidicola]